MQRLHRADLEHLAAVVGAEDVVDDEDALLVEDAEINALAGGPGQVVGPHEGAGAQLVDVQVAVAQPQQLGAQLIAARGGVLLDEALLLQRAQDAVRRALREPQRRGHVGQAEPPLPTGEQPQHRRRPLQRLDGPCHRATSSHAAARLYPFVSVRQC